MVISFLDQITEYLLKTIASKIYVKLICISLWKPLWSYLLHRHTCASCFGTWMHTTSHKIQQIQFARLWKLGDFTCGHSLCREWSSNQSRFRGRFSKSGFQALSSLCLLASLRQTTGFLSVHKYTNKSQQDHILTSLLRRPNYSINLL